MNPRHLLTLPCTIQNRATGAAQDGFGNPVLAASGEPVETVMELQQQGRTEDDDRGQVGEATWLAIWPAGTTVDEYAQVTTGGATYEVVGPPWAARNPRTRQASHVEATLRRTSGTTEESS